MIFLCQYYTGRQQHYTNINIFSKFYDNCYKSGYYFANSSIDSCAI